MREYVKSSGKSDRKSKSPFLYLVNSDKPIKFYRHSNDPDDFADNDVEIPSVVAELQYNYKQYQVDTENDKSVSWLYLSNYPEKAKRIIENMRHQVKFSKPAGVQATITCCVSLGLARLHASGSIKRLSQLCTTFKRMSKTGSLIEGFISKYFEMEIACEVGGKESRTRIPKELKDQIILMSNETGLTQSSIGVLAIYATLIQQSNTPAQFVSEFQVELDNTLELVECKYKGAKTIMGMLQAE